MWEEIGDAIPQGEWQAVIERWWHPDLVYEEDPKWPGSSTYRGRDRIRSVFEGYAEVMGMATFSLERAVPADEEVVALVRVKGDSAAGVPWDHLWGYRCKTRAGKLEHLHAYWDPDEALADAGISSP
jgi:ketosteroid isomerase-like protein